jgi:hypothetical protein
MEKVVALYRELEAQADMYPGSCATGYKDYQHSHAWASDCSKCGEREAARKMCEKLEEVLDLGKPRKKAAVGTREWYRGLKK